MATIQSNPFNVTVNALPVGGTYSVPYIAYDAASNATAFTTFKNWVDGGGYGLSGYHYGIVAKVAEDNPSLGINVATYRNAAIADVMSSVSGYESTGQGGGIPSIANDSYLYVGGVIQKIAAIYSWFFDYLTAGQKASIESFCDQTVYNLRYPASATWYGYSHSHAGYSINSPGNNYYYSFLTAHMTWALASNDADQLSYVRTSRVPLLTDYLGALDGGGSDEGTNYGESFRKVYQLFREWKAATGEDFFADTGTHSLDSIDYWIHVTTPGFSYFVPYGDQTRVATADLFEYQEHLMLELISQYQGTADAERGAWWVNNNQLPFDFGLMLYLDMLRDATWVESAPTDLYYRSNSAGHATARSSWNTGATFVAFECGPYKQNHSQQAQGEFQIWKDEWLAVDEEFYGINGIHSTFNNTGGVGYHNIIHFEVAGTTIMQGGFSSYGPGPNVFTKNSDDGDVLSVTMDTINAYTGTVYQSGIYDNTYSASNITANSRDVTYTRSTHTVLVEDTFSIGPGVTAKFQVNLSSQPSVSGNVITAGNLQMTIISPASPTIELLDWSTLVAHTSAGTPYYYGGSTSSGSGNGGWRVRVGGSSTGYTVQFVVLNGE